MADPNKAASTFGGLLGNAALKLKKRKSRIDEAADDIAEGRDPKSVPMYEDELKIKKKTKK